jgi:hypothetical protein
MNFGSMFSPFLIYAKIAGDGKAPVTYPPAPRTVVAATVRGTENSVHRSLMYVLQFLRFFF